MHLYAQTNIQFLNQLRHHGYSSVELIRIRAADKLTMDLFTGRLQASLAGCG
jgi:hypothetical protein